jgi:hypothetical protein
MHWSGQGQVLHCIFWSLLISMLVLIPLASIQPFSDKLSLGGLSACHFVLVQFLLSGLIQTYIFMFFWAPWRVSQRKRKIRTWSQQCTYWHDDFFFFRPNQLFEGRWIRRNWTVAMAHHLYSSLSQPQRPVTMRAGEIDLNNMGSTCSALGNAEWNRALNCWSSRSAVLASIQGWITIRKSHPMKTVTGVLALYIIFNRSPSWSTAVL